MRSHGKTSAEERYYIYIENNAKVLNVSLCFQQTTLASTPTLNLSVEPLASKKLEIVVVPSELSSTVKELLPPGMKSQALFRGTWCYVRVPKYSAHLIMTTSPEPTLS